MLILAVMHPVLRQSGLIVVCIGCDKKVHAVFCSTLYDELSDDRLKEHFFPCYYYGLNIIVM